MLPIKTVLHATDFSQASTYALANCYRVPTGQGIVAREKVAGQPVDLACRG